MVNETETALQKRQSLLQIHSNEKYSSAKVIEALRASRGMIASAARLLGCTRQTIYDAIARHPEINHVVAGERELLLDHAELKLQEAIDAGEGWAIRFIWLPKARVEAILNDSGWKRSERCKLLCNDRIHHLS